MGLRDLTLHDWVRMSDETARRECVTLGRILPHELQFDGLEAQAYCGREHRIARFRLAEPGDTARFVLVPGGAAELGFDGRDFAPTARQIESFAWSAEQYGIDRPIREYVDGLTSNRRTTALRPILVEIEAREVSVEPVNSDDPVFAQLKREARVAARTEFSDGYIVERAAYGACRAWHRRPTSLSDLQAAIAGRGMRLLTCDEWEHVCGAGAATLFRWGDDCPADFYPTETSARRWRPLSGKRGSAPPAPVWDLHKRPNLFGLVIASDTYRMDIVSDGPHVLGGDGGGTVCGGAGFFLGWLPLATAFRDPSAGEWFTPDNVADGACRVRRVITIPT